MPMVLIRNKLKEQKQAITSKRKDENSSYGENIKKVLRNILGWLSLISSTSSFCTNVVPFILFLGLISF